MKHIVAANEADQRFDRFCRKYFKNHADITLGDIFSRIRKWAIKVNWRKQKEKYRLQKWDEIVWDDSRETEKSALHSTASKKKKIARLPIEEIQKHIIHEDDQRLVFNKPAWIVLHPWQKHLNDVTMHDMLQSYLKQTNWAVWTETFSPQFCFRLDKDTSWVLIAAKTYQALQHLNTIIRERKVSKQYYTILVWELKKKTIVDQPLFTWFDKKMWRWKTFVNREPWKWKESLSTYFPEQTVTHKILWPITMTRVIIKTWRMHQIRVHAAYLWNPVVGDIMYGNPVINRKAVKKLAIKRQLLHSHTYWFFDPFHDKQVEFTARLPDSFNELLN